MSKRKKGGEVMPEYTAYCLSEKRHVKILNPQYVKTRKGTVRVSGTDEAGHKVSRFISKKEIEGSGILGKLLGMPDGKIPIVSDIPIIGALL
jgi:hypothetical protein